MKAHLTQRQFSRLEIEYRLYSCQKGHFINTFDLYEGRHKFYFLKENKRVCVPQKNSNKNLVAVEIRSGNKIFHKVTSLVVSGYCSE